MKNGILKSIYEPDNSKKLKYRALKKIYEPENANNNQSRVRKFNNTQRRHP